MARVKGSKNKKPRLVYPRKCDYCDYISNNPSMWHYHNRTHDPIPEGRLCDHGCQRPALFRGTGGKLTCEKISQQCPAYLERLSTRIKEYWQSEESIERKVKTKNLFLECCAHNEASRQKMREVLRNKLKSMTPTEAREYKVYSRAARRLSRREMDKVICKVDYQVYQIDHILSLYDCWKLGLSVEIAAHLANCKIIHKSQNASKGKKSWISLEALQEKIQTYVLQGPQLSQLIDAEIEHEVVQMNLLVQQLTQREAVL